jgi:hypothetical protein
MGDDFETKERQARTRVADAFGYVEDAFYALVAVALGITGAILFVNVLYNFVVDSTDQPLSSTILAFLDGLLLVFIVTELIHTVRAVIATGVLMAEPFLVVGIVAAIRRLVVISAEAKEMVGTEEFSDVLLELGVLTGAVLLLGITIFLLRHTPSPESDHLAKR